MAKDDLENKTPEEKLKDYEKVFESLAKGPLKIAYVLGKAKDRIVLSVESNLISVTDVSNVAKLKLDTGSVVLYDTKNGVIVEGTKMPKVGMPVTVVEVSDTTITINAADEQRIVLKGAECKDIAVGDKAWLDPLKSVAWGFTKAADLKSKHTVTVTKEVSVKWDDVGGQVTAKAEIANAVLTPKKHEALFRAYNKAIPKGILLYGPPGCGKTLLGRAVATELSGDDSGAFMYVKATELLDPYVGVAEQNIRDVFAKANAYHKETGKTAVIFIDEAEAVFSKRGGRNSFMEKTMVPTFLTEVDGFSKSAPLVILATNRPQDLDPAVIREGRIDVKVKVERPGESDAADILKLYLSKTMLSKGLDVAAAATSAVAFMFSDEALMYEVDADGDTYAMSYGDFISGASLSEVVNKATTIAMERDISVNAKDPSGVTLDDLLLAAQRTYQQNKVMLHHDEIAEVFSGKQITDVRKVA